jgi:hypothetical protein
MTLFTAAVEELSGAMSTAAHELPSWESFELLRTATIGRLCVIEHGYPIAVPVNFRIIERDGEQVVVVRTAPNTLVARYRGPASLEVDHIDLEGGSAWSVIVRGELRRVLGEHSLPDPQPLLTVDRHQWLTLRVMATSSRRFTIEPSDDGYSVEWQFG